MAAFFHDRQYYLVMNEIKGTSLTEEKWNTFSSGDQAIICSKLLEQFKHLRSIPTANYYGRIHHQGFLPWLNLVTTGENNMCGPYKTYEDLKMAISLAMQRSMAKTLPFQPDWTAEQKTVILEFEEMLERTQGSKSLLTHLDPKLDNIIVRQNQGDWEVTLVDWESLGWLPAFLQPVALATRLGIPQEQLRQGIDLGYREEVDCFLKAFRKANYFIL